MSRLSPHIIGIAGGSCAGKSWLAENLRERLGNQAVRLALDDFYLDRAHLGAARRARLNFDHPRAIDWARLEDVLASFAAGESARVPCYDFATHCRRSPGGMLDPAPVIIVEGLWLLRRASVRKYFMLKIYIRGDEKLREDWRLRRDTLERGRTASQAREQWQRQTRPMFWKFVAPQERWADVVLEAPVREADVAMLAGRLNEAMARDHEMVGI
jgi:uridine kinase